VLINGGEVGQGEGGSARNPTLLLLLVLVV
jgi:hypothetical protein